MTWYWFCASSASRPRLDGLEPAFDAREVVDPLVLALVDRHPGIARHVGDRIVAGDEGAIAEPRLEHAVNGARALYLGATIYRIHGTNAPDTIGHAVSSGCFRMVNDEITDLYDRVPVGTKVIVQQ